MTDELMTIGEMCRSFGVTARTLRFYEQKELLAPIREGQKRLYTRRDRARLKLILQGKRFGFSLEEIRQLLDLYDMGDQQRTQFKRTYELALKRLAAMEAQRDELNAAIEDLRAQLEWGRQQIEAMDAKAAARRAGEEERNGDDLHPPHP
ncbi:DNA-binding transcriptional regulator, MerR family [Meinhardsimonia xiamenensis]|jgi:DNA-binding transcriptional MerR regulator|uniref:DNA-binding transcriptional regulator, MerR family n=1 Tax=Meinhardsimonia xiamenensis TaxID=990712 RepID=A0A1G9ALE8_9RHOB|nr:MerR family DNA-binding transcriptional regulator [Meinhardsimonia xiamenensis]PRX35356.1 DNA-binding transcriptional MerR regulator [Meinhardsimonia xiamenensis]SDK27420.1 DNA-binding transcriptional regulator, MerR family [Meinhardsimonia xiamenensis]